MARKELLDELEVHVDWSPATELVNRAYYGEEEMLPQYVLRATEHVLRRAASWRRFKDSACWADIRHSLLMDSRRRMADLVAGKGDPELHRAMLKFIAEFLSLPDDLIAHADRLQEVSGEPTQEVVTNAERTGNPVDSH